MPDNLLMSKPSRNITSLPTCVIAHGDEGKPVLHIHAALGRAGKTTSGCLRPGVTTWLVGEVILYEILGVDAVRIKDEESGFVLLDVR